ncbi:MAG: hypothetical protein AAF320_05550 [Myxococcota bacterium]
MTRSQGEHMQEQIQQLRREVAALQRQQHSLEQQYQTAATGSANNIVQQDRIVAQLQSLAGQIEQLSHDFTQLKQQGLQNPNNARTDAFASLDKTQHLQKAQKLLQTKNYEQAYHAYDALLQRSSKEDAVFVKALFGKAEVCFQWAQSSPRDHRATHYKNAVRAYHEFLTEVPETRRKQETPQVLKNATHSLQALGMTKEAQAFKEELKRVVAKKKKST